METYEIIIIVVSYFVIGFVLACYNVGKEITAGTVPDEEVTGLWIMVLFFWIFLYLSIPFYSLGVWSGKRKKARKEKNEV